MNPILTGLKANDCMTDEMLFKYEDSDDICLNRKSIHMVASSKQEMVSESNNYFTDRVDGVRAACSWAQTKGMSNIMNSPKMCNIDTEREGSVPLEVHQELLSQQQLLDERTTTTTITPTSSPTYEKRGRFLIWPVSENDQLFISTLDHDSATKTQ